MAFFSPYDNVDVKMYISDETLDKYPLCTLTRMREWKKNSATSVVLHNGSILLFDIDARMLKLLIKCMHCDFDISAIEIYLSKTFETHKSSSDCTCVNYNIKPYSDLININISTNKCIAIFESFISHASFLFLTEFRDVLNKYNFDDQFYYSYCHESNHILLCA